MLDREQIDEALRILKGLGVDFDAIIRTAAEKAAKDAVANLTAAGMLQIAKQPASIKQNVKMLLAHYPLMKACRDNAVYDLVTLTNTDGLGLPVDARERDAAIDDLMVRTISKYDAKVSSVEKVAARTHLLIEDLDRALADYKNRCLGSDRESDQRRWRVLEARWLSDTPQSTDAIAADEFVDPRTVRRDLEHAVSDLTVMLFGSEAIKRIASA